MTAKPIEGLGSEAIPACYMIANLLLEWEPGSAYKMHIQWSYTLQPILHLYTGAVMTDLAVGQPKIPIGKQTKQWLVTDWISPGRLCKAPHLHRRCSSQWLLGKWLFSSYHLHHHCYMHMSQDHRQSPLKALLNIFGMHCKTQGMVTRYGNQDAEDVLDAQDSTPLHLTPQDHPMLEGDKD